MQRLTADLLMARTPERNKGGERGGSGKLFRGRAKGATGNRSGCSSENAQISQQKRPNLVVEPPQASRSDISDRNQRTRTEVRKRNVPPKWKEEKMRSRNGSEPRKIQTVARGIPIRKRVQIWRTSRGCSELVPEISSRKEKGRTQIRSTAARTV